MNVPSSNTPSSPDSWIGCRLGDDRRYRLDRRLGGGAVGDVYLAMDVRLGRRIAIKILKGALARSQELLARFEREVALSVALESPHIVQVIDYGVAPGGFPFYAMEYLQGQTLSQFLGWKRCLSAEQTIAIALQLCAGLKVAHAGITLWKQEGTVAEQVKVIHRDLKPANIFMVDTAIGELVKILDFGIAKKLHTNEQADQTNLTRAFLGTFRYAAPEQLKNAWKLDERADIYSLGIILYEMLSGTDPFGMLTKSPNQSEFSWALAHASIAPKPLRQQPDCEWLPADLEAVVMRCLQKQAAERFASVTELSRSLKAINPSVHGTALPEPTQPEDLDPTVAYPLPETEVAPTTAFAEAPPLAPTLVQLPATARPPHDKPDNQTLVPHDLTILQDGTAPKRANSNSDFDLDINAPSIQNFTRQNLKTRSPQPLAQHAASAADRVRVPAQTEIKPAASSLVTRLLPMGVGFAFGLAVMSGAYYFLRSQAPNSPSHSLPSRN